MLVSLVRACIRLTDKQGDGYTQDREMNYGKNERADAGNGQPSICDAWEEGRTGAGESFNGETPERDRPSRGENPLEGSRNGIERSGRPPRGYQAFGFVYIVETADERIKIGITTSLVRRLLQIRYEVVHCPIRLIAFFPGGTATEAWLHSKFANYRIAGDLYERNQAILDFAAQVGLPRRYPETWNAKEAKLKPFMEFR